ncbi:hypothetical protein ACFRQM_39525 [Streptomyces sp. NPDC056831]|uniref:hypothetical protein n=1 Tax=Streptomyces sp. NPDC056831 TaxID=3345954 RepID=UPI0036B7922B
MKAYAGAAPVSRASGRSHIVAARTVKNQRLAAARYMWAFAALRTETPRARYDRRRAGGERHTTVLRNLFNKLLGCLYHCLQNRAHYDPDRARSTSGVRRSKTSGAAPLCAITVLPSQVV